MNQSIATLLAGTKQAAAKRTQADEAAYKRLVRKCAEGTHDVSPEAVVKELERLGRDADELAADVEALAQRIEWAAQLAAGDEASARVDRADADINRIDREFSEAVERLRLEAEAKLGPIRADKAAAAALLRTATEARRRLTETAPPEAREPLAEATRRMSEAGAVLHKLTCRRVGSVHDEGALRTINKYRADLEYELALKCGLYGDDAGAKLSIARWHQERNAKVAHLRQLIAGLEAEYAEIPAKVAAAQAAVDAAAAEVRKAEELLLVA